jgi:hypothetical protein
MNDPAPDSEAQTDSQALVCKIIAGALIAGVTVCLAIVMLMRQTGDKGMFAANPWDVIPPGALISPLGLAMAAMMIVLAPIVAKASLTKARAATLAEKPIDPNSPGMSQQAGFQGLYTLQMIVRSAMYEGAAFFNAVAFFLEGKLPPLIAVLVLIALMAFRFPTRGAMDAFVDEQSELLRQERQAA